MNALRSGSLVALVAAAALAGPGAAAAPREKADLIIENARVYTVDETRPWAQAVAIDDGRIVAVGFDADVLGWRGPDTKVVDLGGRLVLPAFGDAHVHPVFGGLARTRCPLYDGKSVADYQRIIAACVADTPGTGAIVGTGWQDALFPPSGIPTRDMLDAVSTTRPLIFSSVGGHSYWVNSKALELAGISRDTPDPANGKIDRDANTGEPVGALQESAMDLVAGLVPAPTPAELEAAILYTGRLFNSLGITSWKDAAVPVEPDGSSPVIRAYKALLDDGTLKMHVSLSLRWDNDHGLEQIPALLKASRQAKAWGIKATTVKFFEDGVIPQHTAAMIEPYAHSHDRGNLQIAPDILAKAVVKLGAAGIQPYVHAIGDRAVHTALDAFEAGQKANGTAHRPMIAHLNVVEPADQARFGKLGAVAQLQPTWSSNYPYMDLAKQAIGPVRSHYIYPARGMMENGAVIAYGADWPVATANPLFGLQVAVTRINYQEPDTAPLLPDQTITLPEAIRAHTLNVAWADGVEQTTGSITPGKSADLIVLDRNIFAVPTLEIGQTKVLVTLFEGEPVYGSWPDSRP